MKLILSLLFVAFLTISIQHSPQGKEKDKFELKDDVFLVNGSAVFKLEHQGGMGYDFKLKTLDDKEVAFLKMMEFNDDKQISSSNPKGRVTYFDVTFYESGLKCEIEASFPKKFVGRDLYKHGIIKDNMPDEGAIKNFALINGSKFSPRAAGGTIIIINN